MEPNSASEGEESGGELNVEQWLIETENKLENILGKMERKVKNTDVSRGQGKRKTKFIPLDLQMVPNPEHFAKYIVLKFESIETKCSLCPYELKEKLNNSIGVTPKTISTMNNYAFLIECTNKLQAEKLLNVKEICGIACQTFKHKTFNHSKGLVYINEYDLSEPEDFLADLKENNYNIEEATVANFIKTKNDSKALLITFKQPNPPSYLDIPGEASECKVTPFIPKPMICKKCQKYNHTEKYCKENIPRCRRCAEEGHVTEQFTSEHIICCHCSGPHLPTSRECEVYRKEARILEVQDREKVGRRRAQQIIDGSIAQNIDYRRKFPSHFTVKLKNTESADSSQQQPPSRVMNPYKIHKAISAFLGDKPASLRSQGGHYVVQVSTEEQARKIVNLREVCGFICEVTEHPQFNTTKALIYTNDYHIKDTTRLEQALRDNYGVQSFEEATWIKPRNKLTRAFITSFACEVLPEFIDILGERARTNVYEYIPNPMICKRCQEYSHTQKNCKKPLSYFTCRKCCQQHKTDDCRSLKLNCLHCDGEHSVGHNSCPKHQIEKEIVVVQSRFKLNRQQAINHIERNNPLYKKQYSRAINNRIIERNLGNIAQGNAMPAESTNYVREGLQANNSITKDREMVQRLGSVLMPTPDNPDYLTETLPQTPEHYTSENNDEIRQQAFDFYNRQTSQMEDTQEYHPSQPLPDFPPNREVLEKLKKIGEKRKAKRSSSLVAYATRDSTEEESEQSQSARTPRSKKVRKNRDGPKKQ